MITSLLNRTDYPALRENVYLNQASLGLIGQQAVAAMHDFLENVARHGNCNMSDSDEAAYLQSLRVRAAKLLNGHKDRIAVLAGASEILGQLPFLLEPGPEQNIIAVATDFPAITRPWLRLAALKGFSVRFVDDSPQQDLTDSLIDAMDENTAVVAVGSVQYGTGTVVDIARLRRSTAPAGVRLVVDATQAAGAMPVDADAWDADVVVSSGYKWLGGHGGVALAVMTPLLLQKAPPLPGWMGAPDPFDFDATSVPFAEDARRYTQSTMSYISVAGLTIALDQLLALGIDQIAEHARKLADMLVAGVAEHGWQPFRPPANPAACAHIISLAGPGKDTEAVRDELRRKNIVCGMRGGRIRISLAPYNDENDVMAVIETLAVISG